jgi:hypothetical protein
MQPKWLNDGEPDENGDIIAVIENDKGHRISTFKGKSVKEVADKVLESQANANREISRLRRPDQARVPQQLTPKDTQITPADRLRLTANLGDPETVVEAVTEIVTAANGGVPPRAATQSLATMTDAQRDAYYLAEARAFMDECPDYYPVGQNRDKLFATLKANNYDVTRNNLALVFQALDDQGEMIHWPEGEDANYDTAPPNGQQREAQPPPSPTTRPRNISVATGIRRTDASALPPAPRPVKKLTRADLEAMPRAEYNHRLANEPGFRKAVDSL